MGCIIEKTKGVASDTSLVKVGTFIMEVNKASSDNGYIRVEPVYGSDNFVQLEIIGDGYFLDKIKNENLGKNIKINSQKQIGLSAGEYQIIVSKYNISVFQLRDLDNEVSVDNLQNTLLINKNTLSDFKISLSNVELDISTFNACTELTYLMFYSCPNVSGEVSNLLKMLQSNGKKDGTLVLDFKGSDKILLDGVPIGKKKLTVTYNEEGYDIT